MTDRKTRKARLERAGYEWAEGWFPAAYARRVRSQANAYRSDVERIVQEPPRPRGRPRKEAHDGQELAAKVPSVLP